MSIINANNYNYMYMYTVLVCPVISHIQYMHRWLIDVHVACTCIHSCSVTHPLYLSVSNKTGCKFSVFSE